MLCRLVRGFCGRERREPGLVGFLWRRGPRMKRRHGTCVPRPDADPVEARTARAGGQPKLVRWTIAAVTNGDSRSPPPSHRRRRTPNTSGVAAVSAVRVAAHRLSGSVHAASLNGHPRRSMSGRFAPYLHWDAWYRNAVARCGVTPYAAFSRRAGDCRLSGLPVIGGFDRFEPCPRVTG
jgi:hypothetical protein